MKLPIHFEREAYEPTDFRDADHNYVDDADLVIFVNDLWRAAKSLRAAQRRYMRDRGNEAKGRAVGRAAGRLDAVLARGK
jgi:hypothetical protein